MTGTGTLTKNGSGTLSLTAENTVGGGTTLNAGGLKLSAILNSDVTMNGGILSGAANIHGKLTQHGGEIAPGNSIGTITVVGPFIQNGGNLEIEVSAGGRSDRLTLAGPDGRATLNGGTLEVLVLPGAFAPGTTYTIVNTEAGVSGTFSGVTTNLVSAFLAPTLSYDANNVFLTIAQTAPFASAGRTGNQIAAAGGIESLGFGNSVYDAVLMSSAPQARQAFDALSGELHASTAGVLVDDSRYVRGAVLGRLRQAPFDSTAGPLAALGIGGPTMNEIYAADLSVVGNAAPFSPPPASPLTFWAQGFGAWGKIDGNGNAANVDRNLGGAVVGADGRVGAGWRLGLAAGYSQSNISVDARQSSATVDGAHIAVYGGKSFGAWNLRGGAAYAHHQIDTRRTIPGFGRTTADYDGGTGQVFGELGYGFALGRVAIEPFAGLAWVHVNTDGFTEAGSPAALIGLSNTEQVGYSSLGARFATVFAFANGMALAPRVSAAWQHAFGDVTPAASLAFASGSLGFGITGVPLARDSAILEAGADLRINARATLGISYLGQLAGNAQDHAIKGKFVWNF